MNIHDRMIIFLVLALFLGATMEYRHGSKLLGDLAHRISHPHGCAHDEILSDHEVKMQF